MKIGDVIIGSGALNVDRKIIIPQYSEYAKGIYPIIDIPELKELGLKFLTIGST